MKHREALPEWIRLTRCLGIVGGVAFVAGAMFPQHYHEHYHGWKTFDLLSLANAVPFLFSWFRWPKKVQWVLLALHIYPLVFWSVFLWLVASGPPQQSVVLRVSFLVTIFVVIGTVFHGFAVVRMIVITQKDSRSNTEETPKEIA